MVKKSKALPAGMVSIDEEVGAEDLESKRFTEALPSQADEEKYPEKPDKVEAKMGRKGHRSRKRAKVATEGIPEEKESDLGSRSHSEISFESVEEDDEEISQDILNKVKSDQMFAHFKPNRKLY